MPSNKMIAGRIHVPIIVTLGLIGLPFAHAANFTKGRSVKPFTTDLKPC